MAANELPETAAEGMWELCLYVMNRTPRSINALANLRRICRKYLAGRYRLEVVDLTASPERAQRDQIVATPALVLKFGGESRTLLGDLSDGARVLAALKR
jgi:circadian clock protein KaiB